MKVDLNNVPSWLKEDIVSCNDCISENNAAFACALHENFLVAVRIVEITGGTLVREELDNN
jgi:hypothetical protein